MANTIDWMFQGAAVSSINLGLAFTADIGVKVNAANTPNFTAKILLNEKQIGRITWTTAGSSTVVEWYSGSVLALVLVHKDKLSIVRNDTAERVNLDIVRFNLADASTPLSLASIIRQLGLFSPVKGLPVIADMYAKIQSLIPSATFRGTLNIATMVGDVASFAKGEFQLPVTTGLVYPNAAAIVTAIGSLKPPTVKEIFNSWGRMDGQNFYPGGTAASGNAAAWMFNETLQAAVQPNNARPTTGFVSLDSLENYDLAVTLQSDNADNDDIGVILAASVTGNNIDQLSVFVNRGGDGAPFTSGRNQVIYNAAGTGSKVIAASNTLGATGGWNNNFIRVFVKREGDIFTVRISDWNNTTPNEASKMIIDLKSDALLTKFKGPKPYGYITYSQAGAYFKDISLSGGVLQDVLADAATGQVWRYMDGVWGVLPGLTAADIYGAPRNIKDSKTGKIYHIAIDGSMTLVS